MTARILFPDLSGSYNWWFPWKMAALNILTGNPMDREPAGYSPARVTKLDMT